MQAAAVVLAKLSTDWLLPVACKPLVSSAPRVGLTKRHVT